MLKTLRLMLLATLTMVCGSIFAQDETTVLWEASSGDPLTTIYPDGNIRLTWEEGGGDFAPRYSGGSVLFYNGNRLTVAGKTSDVTIKKIKFTYSSGSASLVLCDSKGKNEDKTGIVNSYSGMYSIWTGEANSLIFRAAAQTNNRYISSIEVTYTGGTSGPVVTAPELAISNTTLGDTYDMDNNGVFVVYANNNGTAAAENAKLSVLVDGSENTAWEIGTIAIGEEKWKNMKFNVATIEAGTHNVKLVLTADNAEAVTVEKTVNFTKKAPEATFTVSAPATINVEYGATSFDIVATVKNTSATVDATDVVITLWNNGAIDTKTVPSLAAGAEANVTFTVNAPEGGFTAGKTVSYYVQAPKNQSQATVEVTFAEKPVEETKDLAITGINGTIDLANETSNVQVVVENRGTVDIADAPVTLKAGDKVLGTTTLSVAAEKQSWCYIAVASEGLEAGTLAVTATVEVEGDAVATDNTMDATLTVKAAPVPQAAFQLTAQPVEVQLPAETITVKVTVKNNGEAAGAAEVKLVRGTETLGEAQTTNTLEIGGEQELTFTVANPYTTAGTYDNIQAMTTDNKYGCFVNVTVKEAVEEIVDIALIDIRGLENINLKNENNAVQVWFTNNSTAENLDATITLTMNGTVVGTETIAKGESYKSFTLPTEGLVAGETAALVATLTAAGNKEGNLAEVSKTLDIVSGEEAAEAAFELTADNVEVLTTDAKVKAVVNVKNIGNAKADQVEVKLLQGVNQIGESKYVFGLEAGADQNVTFEFANFDKAGTYELQAVAGKTGKFFTVLVKEPVAELAVESITGTIDLANTSSTVTVTVKNTGDADVKNATVTLTAGDKQLGTATIAIVKAGEQGYGYVQVASEGLTAGDLEVKATVAYAEEKTAELTTTLTVKAAPEPQATFAVTAENVTVPFGATEFNIVAAVKNTSEVAGEVEVKLLKGVTAVETKTVNVAAGAEANVTFTVTEIGEAGKTATYYVQAGTSQAEVTVTFAQQETVKANDLAVESIAGTIDLANTSNNVTVTVKNNGEVDAKNVKATLTFGETTLEKEIASIKAGEQGYAYFQVASEGITGETLAVTAAIDYADDDAANNTATAQLTVKAAPAAEPTFSLTADNVEVTPGQDAAAIVKVTNTSAVDAKDVEVKVLYSTMAIATQKVDIAAGETKDVTFTVTAAQLSQVLAMLGGKTSIDLQAQAGKSQCFFTVTVKEEETPVVDIALIDIRGISEINLKETNTVMVTFQNQSNTDVDASITLKMNGTEIGTQTIAKNEFSKSFTLPTDGLTAGDEVTLVATLNVENNKEGNLAEVSKTLKVVSGEAEPQAVIALNPVASQEVEAAGVQTVNVNVGVFNNGDADAEDVEIRVYQEISTVLATKTVSIKKGESAIVSLAFDYDIQKATTFHVAAYYQNKLATDVQDFTVSIKEQLADVALAKIADIEATTEDNVVIAATVQNKSDIAVENVLVALYKGTEQVGTAKAVNEIAAGDEATVEFALGQLEAGTYSYTVMITSTDTNADNNTQSVTVKVTEPVEQKVEVALTQIQGAQIDLAAQANTITVWVENTGTEAAEATVSVTLNGTTLQAQTVSVAAGKNAFAQFTLPTEGLVAGEKAAVVATVSVEGNTSENVSLAKELDIIDSTVATEPAFEVSAADVEVEMGAEKFDVVATVKNITAIDADDVLVQLFYNGVIAEKTIEKLAGNAEADVTFADVANNFTKAGTYNVSVMVNNKAVGAVNVIVKEPAVEPVFDLAVNDIVGSIDLNNAQSTLSVAVENKGNQDMKDVEVKLTVAQTDYTATITSLKAGDTGYAFFQVAAEGLTAGETTVTAAVEVANDANTADNTLTKTVVVNAADVAQATFSVSAEDVTVPFGATTFNVVAIVANTSDIDAENVEVKFMAGTTLLDKNTIIKLAAGAQKTVTFTVDAPEGGFEAGKTAKYYVQVGTQQAEVTVTFEAEPVAEVYDLAITSISGTLSLDLEQNQLYVNVVNNGNQDATMSNAKISLAFASQNSGVVMLDKFLEVGAGQSKLITFDIDTEDLNIGQMKFKAEVYFIGSIEDAKPEDNKFEKTYTIEAPAPVLSFTVADVTALKDAASFIVNVDVANTGKCDAENVAVKVYDENSALLGETVIATIAAGAEETATITVNKTYTEVGTFKNQLQVYVAGVEGVKWASVTVTDNPLVVGIDAVRAQFGQNVQIFTLSGKKVNDVRKGQVYIINGKKVVVK